MANRDRKSTEISDTVHERVRDWLRNAILAGEFAPGSKIVQTDIAKMLDVSPTPVREAMRDLHAEGILNLTPRRGGTVRGLDVAEVREMRMLCDLLEPVCARFIAERITPTGLAAAERMQEQMEKGRVREEYFHLNRAFHNHLYECSGSPRLASILRSIHDSTPSYLSVTFTRSKARHREGVLEHRQFLEACATRDAATAAQVMQAHWRPVFDEVEKAAAEMHARSGNPAANGRPSGQ